ncbi:MAG: hypothetical protein U0W40_10840 [Acidimicrobiia bacterium]
MTIIPVAEPVSELHLRAATGTRLDHLRHHRARVRDVAFAAHVAPAAAPNVRHRGRAR